MSTTSFKVEVGKIGTVACFLGCNDAVYTVHRTRERLENRLLIYGWHQTAKLINSLGLSGIPQITLHSTLRSEIKYSTLRKEISRSNSADAKITTLTIVVNVIPGKLKISVNGEYKECYFHQLENTVERLIAMAVKSFLDEVLA